MRIISRFFRVFPLFFLVLFVENAVMAASPVQTPKKEVITVKSPLNWYDHLFFQSKSFTFEFIRALGYAYSGGADVGETIATARKIEDRNINSWYQQWLATANRINALGGQLQQSGDTVGAREAYFRASNYYRAAGFYMDSLNDRSKSIATYQQSKTAFLKAIASIPYIHAVKIPYEKTTLPGYFIQSTQKNAPLLIVMTGFDGTGEELYFEVGVAAHARNYNCLIFEGPGQGEVLRQQHLYFRYDWEKVVTPVVNFAEHLPDINKNKIALMGISMGGYLAPRAAAFEPRIHALIANGATYDYSASIYHDLPQQLLTLVTKDPSAFNHVIASLMKKNIELQWFFENGMWTFHVKTPAELMQVIKPYTLKGVAHKITCPTLIVDSEGDMFSKSQAKQLYDHLHSPKKYLVFTRKEAAQAHVQVAAIAVSNALIFHWLDQVFQAKPKRAAS